MAKTNKLAESAKINGKHLLFPTTLYEMQLDPKHLERMKARILDWRDNDDHWKSQEDPVIWVSNDDLYKHKDFKDFGDYVMGMGDTILKDWAIDTSYNGDGAARNIKRTPDHNCYITGMWANISRRHYQHQVHNHPNCTISGIVYLSAPEGSGMTYFNDPRDVRQVFQPDYYGMKHENAYQFMSEPKVGKVVMWPSWLKHSVGPNMISKDEERISLAFNLHFHGRAQRITQRLVW